MHPECTKQRILISAIEQFSEKGYNGVSMRDLARAVQISPPALYNHYASKQALYQSAVEKAFEDKVGHLLSVLQSDRNDLDKLNAFILTAIRQMRDSSEFRRLMQRELLDGDEERIEFLSRAVFSRIQQPFMDLLLKLKPGCDALLLSEIIVGMLKQHYEMGPLHAHTANAGDERSPEAISQLISDVLKNYFTGDEHV